MKVSQIGGVLVALSCSLSVGSPALAQTATDVVCTNCVDGTDLANDSIGGSKIIDGAIRTNDLAKGAVRSANIGTGQVSIGKLSNQVRGLLDASIVSISTLAIYSSDTGVATAECPADRIPVSASCQCDSSNPSSTNLGMLYACFITGTGALAACYDEPITFDPALASAQADVSAICLGATSADGSPWLPASTGLASPAMNPSASVESDLQLMQWRKKQSDEFEAAVKNAHSQYEAYRQRIRSR